MTSEIESLKTNEFLRRRKLRLQQVREQSKDIAKKLRQRAKVEKFRQECDSKKEREYLLHQEKLVKRLEHLYAQGVKSVGDGHKKASEVSQNEVSPEKNDLSRLRGREAVAELRKKRQEKLDEQKKLLDRKLLAREAANEISREKSSSVANKLLGKPSTSKFSEETDKVTDTAVESNAKDAEVPKLTKNDMATQWDFEELPNEWEPNIPALSLPKDDKESLKDSNNAVESKSDKSKRLDLFALSAEMPSSLRGGVTNVPEERPTVKPSVTLVSEYLQSRALRLRDTGTTTGSSKRQSDDLQNLKQTILRTRSSKIEGNLACNNVCHVLDEQVIPVPAWQAESNCEFCPHSILHHKQFSKSRQFTVTNSQINEIFSSIRPTHREFQPSPVLRGSSPFRRNKVCPRNCKHSGKGNTEKSTASSGADIILTKKNSVTMYNHSTRDSRDVPCADSGLVVRDTQNDDDAYSQALRETKVDNSKEKDHQKKLQEMRSKVAMTKQTVEKEYNDTMSFLKSLPKEKCSKHMKNAHMDEKRQQILKMSRQQKLQHEFNKIEKECRRNCAQNAKARQTLEKSRNKSKSPARDDLDNDFDSRDLQYSWMPVPESDRNLAIHTIPTTLKEGKSGNTVKFSKVDSYHEYRSRHKHTPPTKDTSYEKPPKRVVETVLIHNDKDYSTDCSSISSDTSSVENLNLERKKDKQPDQTMSEADRIIVYKVLESKINKNEKKKKKLKLIDDVAKALKSMAKDKPGKIENDNNNNEEEHLSHCNDNHVEGVQNGVSIDQVNEGVYKVVSEKGLSYNVTSCYTANVEMWQTTAEHKPWWDNITSLYFSDKPQQSSRFVLTEDELKHGRPCCCSKKKRADQQSDKGTNLHCGNGDISAKRHANCLGCKCGCTAAPKQREHNTSDVQHSAATSTSSFKTAKNDKALGALPDGGYIKLIDDDGQEAGKFYIGASGFLRDDAYEVIIQLRKKECAKKESEKESSKNPQENINIQESTGDLKEKDKSPVRNACSSVKDISNMRETNENERIEDKTSEKLSSRSRETNENERIEDKTSETLSRPTSANKKNNNDIISEETVAHVERNGSKHLSLGIHNEPVENVDRSKKYVDKGVYTTTQLSYAIPSHVPKTDPISRPATSTYTQTSMDSPNQRPLFMHMSSSTSTAYMSPPEMVLPKYFKQDNNFQGEKLLLRDPKEHCKNETCRSKRCKCRKIKLSAPCKKTESVHKNFEHLNTPPNTARNNIESSDGWDHEFEPPVKKIHSRKCHKFDTNRQCHGHKKKTDAPLNKLSSRNLVMRVTSSTASSFRNKNKINSKVYKTNLNPVIKKYVNKLLELNREGIKAIEVANQECSSVATPGSSIVEVPTNINAKKSGMQQKISLEQMKNDLKQKILEEYVKESTWNNSIQTLYDNQKSRMSLNKFPKKRSVHKVKSLNISKRLLNTKKSSATRCSTTHNMKSNPSTSSPSSARDIVKKAESFPNKSNSRSKSSPTPRQYHNIEFSQKNTRTDSYDSTSTNNAIETNRSHNRIRQVHNVNQHQSVSNKPKEFVLPFNKATTTSPESEANMKRQKPDDVAANISTQTSQDLDCEINLMKLAEDKLQNMEKIADLTEKCTKRLSNLAKVLEEVRKNKSLAYSQISTSDTASDSEQRSDKNIYNINTKLDFDSNIDMPDENEPKSTTPPPKTDDKDDNNSSDTSEYIPFLTNIPKPTEFKYPVTQSTTENHASMKAKPLGNSNIDNFACKNRGKPPPALSRIHLKHGQDIVPHELSTVVEVDSPMSLKLKNQSSRNNTKCEISDLSYKNNNGGQDQKEIENPVTVPTNTDLKINPDLLQNNNMNVSKHAVKRMSSTDSSDDSKVQMMDLKQFNELMLKPFISIKEFAKQCDIDALDDGSNLDDIPKDDMMNDEMSSLHSDGSLPDVIAELLKRNIITEPFKFDTVSNVNSTTVSSESTLSVLALSKVRKEKKKSSVVFKNKENVSETSDTLSISSNPDLENAFKKLGMGWASSTLKKTKERLALSSSSNTSSSSLSQFKLKCLNNQDIPALVTDSVSSANKIPRKIQQEKDTSEISKNAEQQTSFMNSMTVREFLTNELAKKITFTNKSNRNDTEEEFVSLFETKMPEEMKHLSQTLREERTIDSLPSGNNNRARTSTPVQLFKSTTYHSSSSSNMSNGLFSNADDLSSVKVTSNSIRNHSTSDKDDLTIPNCSLKTRKGASDCSKSE